MNATEKLCLQWNDFKDNVTSSFRELREDVDFTDVTLVCEDGKQMEAHKVILAASSPFFKEILKRSKHPHPLVFMKGLKSEDLLAILDFLYFGEANVLQENLDSFLALAEELRLKGLTGTDNSGNDKEPTTEVDQDFENAPTKRENDKHNRTLSRHQYRSPTKSDTAVAVQNNSINTKLQYLDDQIKSMMTKTGVKTANGQEYMATCNICGKQAAYHNIQSHIEAKHITGVSHSCSICGKTSRSRDASRKHKQTYHKINMPQD